MPGARRLPLYLNRVIAAAGAKLSVCRDRAEKFSPSLATSSKSWFKERINWEGDPFGGPVETFDDVRRRMADQRRVDRARGTGNAGEANKVEREMRAEQVINVAKATRANCQRLRTEQE